MATNFFETIESLQITGDLKMNIQQQTGGEWLVSVLLVNEKVQDSAKNTVPPMNFKGTAKELDEGFFAALQKPVQQTSALFTNMQEYAEALEEAKRKSKLENEKEDRDKKDRDERKKKYDTAMKRVSELEEKKRYGEAIGAMPKAEQFPEQADDIKKKTDALREKHGQLTLL